MEDKSAEVLHDGTSKGNGQTEFGRFNEDVKDVGRLPPSSLQNDQQGNMIFRKGEIDFQDAAVDAEKSGEVNMEASIAPEDVMKAGGFGARDDIGSFLPVASDSTDFEETIRNARDYEDQQRETCCRPGLGWVEQTERK